MYEEINAFFNRPSIAKAPQHLATKKKFVEELNRIYKLPSISNRQVSPKETN